MRPMPGIVIVKPEKDTKTLVLTNQNQTRLLKGKVISIGKDVIEGNTKRIMNNYVSLGETVYFLSYDGDYDNALINNERYYMVKVDDLRASI